MNIIKHNPFRVLGLSVTASDRQIAKRVNELSTLYEFGKAKVYDTDFPFISDLERSPETIERATSQIELPQQKLFCATFWFWDDNSIDELVFEVLKDGGVDHATTLWERPIEGRDLSRRNYSNYKNLALLNLILAVKDEMSDHEKLSLAIGQFMAFFSDANYANFSADVSGKTHTAEAMASKKSFVDELARHLITSDDKADAATVKAFIAGFDSASGEIRSYVKGRFTTAPIHRIEAELDSMTDARRRHPEDAYESAKELHRAVKKDLAFLKDVLTEQDLHYQSIADRIVGELLECSTVYYNANHENDTTTATLDRSKEISLLAKSLAVGQAAKRKIQADLAQLKQIRLGAQIESLGTKFMQAFSAMPHPNSISARQVRGLPGTLDAILGQCRPILEEMKKIGGDDHETYVFCSDLLAMTCLGFCIKYVNETRDCESVAPIMKLLTYLRMTPESRSRLNKNLTILTRSAAVLASQKSSGCYIATWAYGSYDAAEVVVLRRFRDEILVRSFSGRVFIRCYYGISPFLVRVLRNRHELHRLIRYLLSKVVGVLN